MSMKRHHNRRRFLTGAASLGVGALFLPRTSAATYQANEKLDIAVIGVGGRGRVNLMSVADENLVALCDVDQRRAGDAFERFPKAAKYDDFRRMLTERDRHIDAVVVSTPDHTHAVASVMAMKMGKHVYCEKPLARTIGEARVMAELAAKEKLATQLGIQRHCWQNYHRAVELIRKGTIGPVRECHVWIGGNRGGGERPRATPPIPPHLKWDLWLGPAAQRPYHPAYVPYLWRFWWDFGTGEMGNMGCHIMDLPFGALSLGAPAVVEAEGPPAHSETSPQSMRVRYEFPARGDLPPLELTWSHGTKPAILADHVVPADWRWGALFVGRDGMLLADLFRWKLLPESKYRDHPPAKWPQREVNGSYEEWDAGAHYREWIDACKTGRPTACNFGYGAALTETVLLANVAYRAGQRLQWDAKKLTASNCPEAQRYIEPRYRNGWTL